MTDRNVQRKHEQTYWDGVAASFGGESNHELWRRHSDRVNCTLLAEWLPTGGVRDLLKTDLFDEATAAGLYPFLAERCENVTGVDISAQAVEIAARKYPRLVARRADLRALPFADGSFDCVVSNSTLDHFEQSGDIVRALRELYRVMRPGGCLLLTMDNPHNPMVWLRNHLPFAMLRRAGLVPYFVGRTLGRRGLDHTVRAAGFDPVEGGAVMHCPRVLAVARARRLQQGGAAAAQSRFLERLWRWERLRRWPTRYLTGHFVALKAVRPASGSQ